MMSFLIITGFLLLATGASLAYSNALKRASLKANRIFEADRTFYILFYVIGLYGAISLIKFLT